MGKYILLFFLLMTQLQNSHSKHRRLYTSICQFSIDAYKDLVSRKADTGNLVFCPIGLAVVLSFLWEGALGNTEKELGRALRLDKHKHELVDAFFSETLRAMNRIKGQGATLELANSIWVKDDPDIKIKANFSKHLEQVYNTQELRFTANRTGVDRINRWCFERTKGKISKIVNEIPENSVMILLNAVHFKGKWQRPFDSSKTTKRFFTTSKGQKVKIPFMVLEKAPLYYKHCKVLKAEVACLPYNNNATRMILILPDKGTTLEQLEARMTVPMLKKSLAGIPGAKVTIYMPKFKLESDLELVPTVRRFKVVDAFDETKANFGAIFDTKHGPIVNRIGQKAHVEVNELGTEASAVTVGQLSRRSGDEHPELVFDANRPFMYLIHHQPTYTILFMGRFGMPTK